MLGLVGYVAFSIGIIAGCLMMTKGDSDITGKKTEKKMSPSECNTDTNQNLGSEVGK
jgi:hypothetical protein